MDIYQLHCLDINLDKCFKKLELVNSEGEKRNILSEIQLLQEKISVMEKQLKITGCRDCVFYTNFEESEYPYGFEEKCSHPQIDPNNYYFGQAEHIDTKEGTPKHCPLRGVKEISIPQKIEIEIKD
jgi:hypothetical protein